MWYPKNAALPKITTASRNAKSHFMSAAEVDQS
jgi:hypothetical protein